MRVKKSTGMVVFLASLVFNRTNKPKDDISDCERDRRGVAWVITKNQMTSSFLYLAQKNLGHVRSRMTKNEARIKNINVIVFTVGIIGSRQDMNEVVVVSRAANKDTCSSYFEPKIFFKWRLKELILSNSKYL